MNNTHNNVRLTPPFPSDTGHTLLIATTTAGKSFRLQQVTPAQCSAESAIEDRLPTSTEFKEESE